MTSSTHPYNSLSPEKVIDAVEGLGYFSDARVMALNSYENRVYQVGIEDETPLIAKFYRPERYSREQILEEHDFLQELKAQELPVVAPIVHSDGETLHHADGFHFALFPRQGGHAPELDNLDNLYILGRTLGRVHGVGAAKPFDHRPTLNLQRFGIDSRSFLLDSGMLPSYLEPQYDAVTAEILQQLQAQEVSVPAPLIRVHGDCHRGNILWRDETPHFVDFDDSCMAPAVQDIWMLLSGSAIEQTQQLSEIVDGYNEFMDFDPRQLKLIEFYRTLRLMHYSAWLARRWDDPAFPQAFSWFGSDSYWQTHINELRDQLQQLSGKPLLFN